MKKMNLVQFISIGGILTAITVIFQSAPIFLSTIGLALSPFSTLPIALGAYYNISLGITTVISSVLILIFISMEEALVLLFTTGLLGITLGLLYKKSFLISVLYTTMALSIGMILLTYVVGISAFGDFTSSFPISITFLIFIAFSFLYSAIWNKYFKKFIKYLIRMKVL